MTKTDIKIIKLLKKCQSCKNREKPYFSSCCSNCIVVRKREEDVSITYENNIFYCTKNNTKWISVDGEEWYGEEKRIKELEQKLEQTEKDLADYQFNYPTIKELEKENRLLGERCNQLLRDKGELTDQIADIKANCDLAIEGRDVKIKELEQENAELKETLKTYNGCGDWDNDFHTCRVYLQHEELQMYINQLTKAKDHIKQLLDCLKQDTNDPQTNYYVCQYMDKAEQFLKEIEK